MSKMSEIHSIAQELYSKLRNGDPYYNNERLSPETLISAPGIIFFTEEATHDFSGSGRVSLIVDAIREMAKDEIENAVI